MKVSIMQPNLFMWNGLLKQIIDSDLHIILDTVKSSKNSRYNRNRIAGSSSITWLTVPFTNFSRDLPISELRLNTSSSSFTSISSSFERRYSSALFFHNSFSLINQTLRCSSSESKLTDVYLQFLSAISSLGLPLCRSVLASSLLSHNPGLTSLHGINLVNSLLETVSATCYLAAQNTANYARPDDYAVSQVMIQQFNYLPYPQSIENNLQFIPNLSCLDLLSYQDIHSSLSYLASCNTWNHYK